jgi:hypothetical protein
VLRKPLNRLTPRSPHSTVSVARGLEHFGEGLANEEPCRPRPEGTLLRHSALAGQNGKQIKRRASAFARSRNAIQIAVSPFGGLARPFEHICAGNTPYVPPQDSHFSDSWPLEEEIGLPGYWGIWSSQQFWVPLSPDQYGYHMALWANNWAPNDINGPGFGAGVSTDFPWPCDGDPTSIHIDNVQMAVYFTGAGPMISGPDNVWYFNGLTPPTIPPRSPSNQTREQTLSGRSQAVPAWSRCKSGELLVIPPALDKACRSSLVPR